MAVSHVEAVSAAVSLHMWFVPVLQIWTPVVLAKQPRRISAAMMRKSIDSSEVRRTFEASAGCWLESGAGQGRWLPRGLWLGSRCASL